MMGARVPAPQLRWLLSLAGAAGSPPATQQDSDSEEAAPALATAAAPSPIGSSVALLLGPRRPALPLGARAAVAHIGRMVPQTPMGDPAGDSPPASQADTVPGEPPELAGVPAPPEPGPPAASTPLTPVAASLPPSPRAADLGDPAGPPTAPLLPASQAGTGPGDPTEWLGAPAPSEPLDPAARTPLTPVAVAPESPPPAAAGWPTPPSAAAASPAPREDEEWLGVPAMAAAPAEGVAAPPPPPPDPLPARAPPPPVRCPFCTGFGGTTARGLFMHIGARHRGQRLGSAGCVALRGYGRGVCAAPGCGHIRPLSQRACPQCSAAAPPRAPREEDRVRGAARALAAALPPLHADSQEDRAAWLERVRGLPPGTLLHVPVAFRARLAMVAASTLEGVVNGDAEACALEQARSKLLLGVPPRGSNTRVELARRLALWEEGAFEELLLRAEEQARARAGPRDGLPEPAAASASKARRARHLVREGAYSKAVASLTSDVASLSPGEQRLWGQQLLPCSTDPQAALAVPQVVAAAAADALPAGAADAAAGAAAPAAPAAPVPGAPLEAPAPAEQPGGHAPLAGVRFRACSAPGPSGARPEHLRELVACRDRRASARLQRAVGLLCDQAAAGALCEGARWLLESRLVFLRKKRGPAPRPIRIGELWRRVIAKRLLHVHRDAVQAACRAARQFGVGEPGGADALVHWRVLLEELLAGGAGHGVDPGDAVAVIDVDLANAFPSLEWGYVRAAVGEQLPALLPWTAWVHQAATPVQLPCGERLQTDRGAEQGDPLGPLYCALALARVIQRVRSRGPAFCDAWYMDDGQILCRARHVPAFLAELDAELFDAGAARGRGSAAKSVVAVPAPAPLAAAARPHWATAEVLHSVAPAGGPRHVLGIDFGDDEGEPVGGAPSAQFAGAAARVAAVHSAVAALGDVPAELVLLRRCADVCKVVHLLRASGPALAADALAGYDAMVERSLGRLLGGPLDAAAVAQARLGARVGGLGLRSAADLALPAFYASRTEAAPHVARLAAALDAYGFADIGLLPRFEAQREEARAAWLATLPPALATEAQAALDAWAAREDTGTRPAAGLPGEALLLPAGDEDPERAGDGSLQHLLCGFADRARAAASAPPMRLPTAPLTPCASGSWQMPASVTTGFGHSTPRMALACAATSTCSRCAPASAPRCSTPQTASGPAPAAPGRWTPLAPMPSPAPGRRRPAGTTQSGTACCTSRTWRIPPPSARCRAWSRRLRCFALLTSSLRRPSRAVWQRWMSA